jgi:hypothetical protein
VEPSHERDQKEDAGDQKKDAADHRENVVVFQAGPQEKKAQTTKTIQPAV